MKKLVYLLAALSLVACNKNEDDANVVKKEYSAADFATMKEVRFDVEEGQYAVVTVGGEEFAKVYGPAKNAVAYVPVRATLEDGLKSTYSYGDLEYKINYYSFSGESSSNTMTFNSTICFEDMSENIDADYNDLIVDIKSTMIYDADGKVSVKFQELTPIAMGATYDMGFGYRLALVNKDSASKEIIFSEPIMLANDVRSEFFGGTKGMINTYRDGVSPESIKSECTTYETETKSEYNKTFYLKDLEGFAKVADFKNYNLQMIFFINVKNTKKVHYALYVKETANNSGYLLEKIEGANAVMGTASIKGYEDIANCAMGLVLANYPSVGNAFTFKYPAEKIFFGDVYSRFMDWLDGKVDYVGFNNPVEDLCYQK